MPNEKICEIDLRRALVVNARRAARKNDALGRELLDFRRRDIAAHDLGINLTLADAPGDDLRVLRAEIEDEDARNGPPASLGAGVWVCLAGDRREIHPLD